MKKFEIKDLNWLCFTEHKCQDGKIRRFLLIRGFILNYDFFKCAAAHDYKVIINDKIVTNPEQAIDVVEEWIDQVEQASQSIDEYYAYLKAIEKQEK